MAWKVEVCLGTRNKTRGFAGSFKATGPSLEEAKTVFTHQVAAGVGKNKY